MKIEFRKPSSAFIVLLIASLHLLLLMGGIRQLWLDPKAPLLVSEGGAAWIRFPQPIRLPIHWSERWTTSFRQRLDVEKAPAKAVLTLRAMKQADVHLDGALLFRSQADPKSWKESRHIDLAPFLTAGSHELRIDVVHENGHPALLAYCSALGIRTDERWEASRDGRRWLPAVTVDDIPRLAISQSFPRSDRALRSLLPLFVPLFALAFFWSLRSDDRLHPGWMEKVHFSPGMVRWLLLAAWLIMAVNNFWKIPLSVGMDHVGHFQYIKYMAANWRVPLATEGWQMFQPPLFYFLEAVLFRSFSYFFSPDTVIRILKLLPLMCGAAQVEICYRTVRYAYPKRESLQVIGTLLGGLLPMNLYMSQSLGNEPLAALFTAILILLTCRVFSGDLPPGGKILLSMGLLLGLALLSKNSAALIIPPVLFFVASFLFQKSQAAGDGLHSVTRFVIIFLGSAVVVCGWYYLRNYIEVGTFFVVGSYFIGSADTSRQMVWWQDPGYRTLQQCYTFGEALFYPIYSSIHGFWNAIYSSFWMDGYMSSHYETPWNYTFMLSSAWPSLLPTAAIVIGAFVSLQRGNGPLRQMLRFSLASIMVYLAAIFYIFLTVPVLSSAKATYALGLIPCFILLGTAGFEALTRQRFIRAAVNGILVCWVVGAYAAYFVI